MVRKVIIEVRLIPESDDISARKIKDEILNEFSQGFLLIPYADKIEKIKVAET